MAGTNGPTQKQMYLVDTSSEYFTELDQYLTLVRSNTNINRVDLGNDFVKSLTTDDRISIFSSIGQIKSLRELRIFSCHVGLKEISTLIESADCLEVIELENLTLEGTDDDMIDFEYAISSSRSMKKFRFDTINVESFENILNEIIRALCKVPSLESLTIIAGTPQSGNSISNTTIMVLLRTHKDLNLTLTGFGEDPAIMKTINLATHRNILIHT